MNRDPRDVIIRPVVSEKSYAAYDANVYTFVVADDANKIEIRHAVEKIFGVKVTNVNTMNGWASASAIAVPVDSPNARGKSERLFLWPKATKSKSSGVCNGNS